MRYLKVPTYQRSDGTTDMADYVNNPSEVRAFMQEIINEVLDRNFDRLDTIYRGTDGQKLMKHIERNPTWITRSPLMSEANKRKIMQAVARAVTEHREKTAALVYDDGRDAYIDTETREVGPNGPAFPLPPSEHYKEVCRECETVIGQCRCMSPHKVTRYGLCDACAGIPQKEPSVQWLHSVKMASRVASHHTPAEAVAINLLVADPDMTLPEAIRTVRDYPDDLYDDVSGEMVPPKAVLEALEKMLPHPLSGAEIRVYHATDAATAKMLLRRGFIPETKPRARSEDFEYAPGRGILDVGLYVGASPHAVESYGRAILEINVPKKLLDVPTELAQLGEDDPLKALKSHDGAIINTRLPADVFRLMPDLRTAAERVVGRFFAVSFTK